MPSKRPSLRDRPVLPAVGRSETDDFLMGVERQRHEVHELPVAEIMPNRYQPRTQPSDEGLTELAASIREHGVLQPILVQAISLQAYDGRPCRYELIAGERRWRACQRAGRETIPALVIGTAPDDRQLLVLALIENLQREGLHPLDEGMAFAQLQTEFSLTQHEIAERVGKSRGYVQNRIRLTTVPEDLQHLVAERPDTITHVYEIARLEDPQARRALIAAVRDDRISHAETRARVAALLAPADAPEALRNDLYKSQDGLTSLGAPFAEAGLREQSPQVAPKRRDATENDLRKSLTPNTRFLSSGERAALAAIAARIEAGAGLPEGADLELLVHLSTLVAALLPDDV